MIKSWIRRQLDFFKKKWLYFFMGNSLSQSTAQLAGAVEYTKCISAEE